MRLATGSDNRGLKTVTRYQACKPRSGSVATLTETEWFAEPGGLPLSNTQHGTKYSGLPPAVVEWIGERIW